MGALRCGSTAAALDPAVRRLHATYWHEQTAVPIFGTVKKPAPRTEPATPTAESAEPLAKIAAMILELDELRAREPNTTIVSAYRVAIDRLHGLIYRIQTRPRPCVIGLPEGAAAPPEAPHQAAPSVPERDPLLEAPQRTPPLGAVIVKARKPKRR